jgi:hypothetical protein
MILGFQPGQTLKVTESPLDSFTVVQGRNAGAYRVSLVAYVEAPFLTTTGVSRAGSYPEVHVEQAMEFVISSGAVHVHGSSHGTQHSR